MVARCAKAAHVNYLEDLELRRLGMGVRCSAAALAGHSTLQHAIELPPTGQRIGVWLGYVAWRLILPSAYSANGLWQTIGIL